MPFIYRIKSHLFSFSDGNDTAVLTDSFYSGHNEGLNNPSCYAPNVGPLPSGKWEIGQGSLNFHLGPLTMNLIFKENLDGTNKWIYSARNQFSFFIHGDNSFQNHSASEGCLVAPHIYRQLINLSTDRDLIVYPE